jgi:hypothetical protein
VLYHQRKSILKAVIEDVGKVGRTRALELDAKVLFKGRVQKGELRVGQVGSDGSDCSDCSAIERTVWTMGYRLKDHSV